MTEETGRSLTAPQREAAILVADDELTDERIAAQVGVTSRTLRTWKSYPEFQAAVADHRMRLEAAISRFWIAKRRKRVEKLQLLADKAVAVIEQRAADSSMDDVPGGSTGVIVRDVKSVGYGTEAELVDVYKVDTALMAELRNLMKQAAQEVGQWSEKHEITKDTEELTQVIFFMPEKGSQPPIFPAKRLPE